MKIARILYPVTVLGPGRRIGIWTAGCHRRCEGCANPELWEARQDQEVSAGQVLQLLEHMLKKDGERPDGITVSGGEPFDQPEELLVLLRNLSAITDDILVYTGYSMHELKEQEILQSILKYCGCVIDGTYQKELNRGEILRGSENQQMYMLNPGLSEKYEEYLKENQGRHLVESFRVADGVVAVGIHRGDFRERLIENLQKKQIRLSERKE